MNQEKILAIGSDHAGYEYKEILRTMLADEGYEVINFGTDSPASVDYPDFVHPVCEAMEKGNATVGILLCGSANGVAMAANRHKHVRAAVCWDTEIAQLSRSHNDANIICIPSRFVAIELAHEMTEKFLNTAFEGGRHQRRVEKIEYV
ncbi:MAG TPA: ribose 5-phosphate isomerase B [Chitinophagales bacterium]|nr:ribose 5-phosphate isomerase B [Chitinophagales bacterium]